MEDERKMAMEDAVIQALGHRERRKILKIVMASEQGASYSEIAAELGINTGSMNYHLRQLQGLIERDGERRYRLTPLGERSLSVLNYMTEDPSGVLEAYLDTAWLSQSGSIHPTVTGLLYIGLAFDILFLFVWGYMGYLAAVSNAPIIILLITSVLFILGLLGLFGIIRALKTAPTFVRRLERKLGVV